MRIAVVGGGPAGLYASLLIKKWLPHHEIILVEKNPPDATYGWGVVFSDRTLTSFREADYKSYVDIIENFVMWDSIDIRFRDEVVRCGGQVFSGIARKKLLNLLQARCRELEVDLRFHQEAGADDPGHFDLVIAADGVHSVFRSELSHTFRPSLKPGASKYIWFGTPRPFDSFTFVFRPTEHGLFQAHAYPFDGEMSTFIVECGERTWRAAGLDLASDAESIAFCEKLFDEDLGGRPLLSNNSKWVNFVTVKNKTWRCGNVVLVGDAAHTAHFSIGSGTKLAMEDAIALANSLQNHAQLEAALADYELERKPRVERFQEAARQSQAYFENTDRYLELEPVQFAFALLTRSGRIDYDDLRTRDPGFVSLVDRHFSAGGRVEVVPPPAFTPVVLGGTTISNRVAVGQVPADRSLGGEVDEASARELAALASRGFGLVMTEPVAVSAHGRVTPGSPGLYDEADGAAWTRAIDLIHDSGGALVALKLSHSGVRGSTRLRHAGLDVALVEGWPTLSPSDRPYTAEGPAPARMDRAKMDDVCEDFATAAGRAGRAEFDVLVIDMAGGSLLAAWLSPLVNDRADSYGGSISNRLRYPLEVLDAVRAQWPRGRPLGVALTAHDWAKGGLTASDGVSMARALKDHGCDVVEVHAGQSVANYRPRYDPYYLVSYSDRIRNEAGIATIATGQITSVDAVNTIVGGGRADLCLMLT